MSPQTNFLCIKIEKIRTDSKTDTGGNYHSAYGCSYFQLKCSRFCDDLEFFYRVGGLSNDWKSAVHMGEFHARARTTICTEPIHQSSSNMRNSMIVSKDTQFKIMTLVRKDEPARNSLKNYFSLIICF